MRDDGFVQRGYRIVGRVQGVYFRAWTRMVANEMGIRGTVRNRLDGSVEAHVVGSAPNVSEFESRLWEGPTASDVEAVETIPSDGVIPDDGFRIPSTV